MNWRNNSGGQHLVLKGNQSEKAAARYCLEAEAVRCPRLPAALCRACADRQRQWKAAEKPQRHSPDSEVTRGGSATALGHPEPSVSKKRTPKELSLRPLHIATRIPLLFRSLHTTNPQQKSSDAHTRHLLPTSAFTLVNVSLGPLLIRAHLPNYVFNEQQNLPYSIKRP